MKLKTLSLFTLFLCFLTIPFTEMSAQKISTSQEEISITQVKKLNSSTLEIAFSNNQKMYIDFYGENIFRMFQDNSGQGMRSPQANPPAEILVKSPRRPVSKLSVNQSDKKISIETFNVSIQIAKDLSSFKVINTGSLKTVVEFLKPVKFDGKNVTLTLKADDNEYFYGGGVQNGRFSHKGKAIAIENQNSWTDGGVASPTPFYWSTKGYGFMAYTFRKGVYDFGRNEKNTVQLTHNTDYLDVFFMINDGIVPLLNDFYQLTGKPVLIPKFGFYQGHLNAYNRDYWLEDEKGIPFEDGKHYKESQKDNGGIKESLNGELNNYMFSARGVIDRYKAHDMPLGWILPNDGYGAGYGQTSTLDGNIQNLKTFGDYARKNGVEIGLWTQSDLHPKAGIEPLLQRDIVKEVGVAGVRVLKTDVAWVGAGYSFGLNGVQDVANIMPKYGNKARPFIISLDGWAGTQHYATIWTGDQTGGVWEYIRFHIPTYIGSGLSGQPNICSDMDGIFGGKNAIVNIRDFQWKTFTLMQLNMDGWGSNEKYPHALGEPAASINRIYLKLKSELIPYTYSIARQSVDDLPSMRAMFLEEENTYTLGKSTQYQFMYGPYFLVAPIYQNTCADENGNDVRNGIYLPRGEWIDYFSGQKYEGGRIINNMNYPIWKLPVFVKNGAIIPMTNPNNNPSEIMKGNRIYEIYPSGDTSFTEYDDDGETTDYLSGKFTETEINSSVLKDIVTIQIKPTKGDFTGFEKNKSTEIKLNVSRKPKRLTARIGGKKQRLKEVKSLEEYHTKSNVYFYNVAPELNQFATANSKFADVKMIKNPQVWVKIVATDVTKNEVSVAVKGFENKPISELLKTSGSLHVPENLEILDTNATACTLKPSWNKTENADYYELEFDGMLYSTIRDNELLIENLQPETEYTFKLRAVNKDGVSDWVSYKRSTKADPLQFAIRGIKAESTAKMQGGESLSRLFDFDEGNMMHTQYGENVIPFEIVMDLKSINQLDKMEYLPRSSGLNGMFETGQVFYSSDKENWTFAGSYEWKRNFDTKIFQFENNPVARYIKIAIEKGVGNFGSGREIYVFKVPGSETYLPGDVNNDKLIDANDLTSYLNYTGLRLGDSDFEGYVSRGDVNNNKLIDAYDISNAAVLIEGGASNAKIEKVTGSLSVATNKQNYKVGEIVEITVKGKDLKSVNALSFALPYDPNEYEFVGIKSQKTNKMQNFTNDRLHTSGDKVLYPTFVNVGDKPALEGSESLFVIQLKAKKSVKFNLIPQSGVLVDKDLRFVTF